MKTIECEIWCEETISGDALRKLLTSSLTSLNKQPASDDLTQDSDSENESQTNLRVDDDGEYIDCFTIASHGRAQSQRWMQYYESCGSDVQLPEHCSPASVMVELIRDVMFIEVDSVPDCVSQPPQSSSKYVVDTRPTKLHHSASMPLNTSVRGPPVPAKPTHLTLGTSRHLQKKTAQYKSDKSAAMMGGMTGPATDHREMTVTDRSCERLKSQSKAADNASTVDGSATDETVTVDGLADNGHPFQTVNGMTSETVSGHWNHTVTPCSKTMPSSSSSSSDNDVTKAVRPPLVQAHITQHQPDQQDDNQVFCASDISDHGEEHQSKRDEQCRNQQDVGIADKQDLGKVSSMSAVDDVQQKYTDGQKLQQRSPIDSDQHLSNAQDGSVDHGGRSADIERLYSFVKKKKKKTVDSDSQSYARHNGTDSPGDVVLSEKQPSTVESEEVVNENIFKLSDENIVLPNSVPSATQSSMEASSLTSPFPVVSGMLSSADGDHVTTIMSNLSPRTPEVAQLKTGCDCLDAVRDSGVWTPQIHDPTCIDADDSGMDGWKQHMSDMAGVDIGCHDSLDAALAGGGVGKPWTLENLDAVRGSGVWKRQTSDKACLDTVGRWKYTERCCGNRRLLTKGSLLLAQPIPAALPFTTLSSASLTELSCFVGTVLTYNSEGSVFYVPASDVKVYGDPSGEPWFYPLPVTPLQATVLLSARQTEGCFLVYRQCCPLEESEGKGSQSMGRSQGMEGSKGVNGSNEVGSQGMQAPKWADGSNKVESPGTWMLKVTEGSKGIYRSNETGSKSTKGLEGQDCSKGQGSRGIGRSEVMEGSQGMGSNAISRSEVMEGFQSMGLKSMEQSEGILGSRGISRSEGMESKVTERSKVSVCYCLAVCAGLNVLHYDIVRHAHGDLSILGDDRSFLTLSDLITYFRHNRSCLATRLRRPLSLAHLPATAGHDYDASYELYRSQLALTGSIIASGRFGVICTGLYRHQPVAIKVLNCCAGASVCGRGLSDEEMEWLEEARCLSLVSDRSVIRLIGLVIAGGPWYIVTELASQGSLKDSLRNSQHPADIHSLLRICSQVVRALCYLDSLHYIIHRDLAARNFIMTHHSTVKLADFGRARYVCDDDYQADSSELISIKWSSPEVLVNSRYSTRSDLWAAAVVIWEVLTGGERPYSGLTAEQTAVYVLNGGRLDRPSNCPRQLYTQLLRCWRHSVTERQSCTELGRRLQDISVALQQQESLRQTSSLSSSSSSSFSSRPVDSEQRSGSADDLLTRSDRIRTSLRKLVNIKV